MTASVHRLSELATCAGRGLVLGAAVQDGAGAVDLALASIGGEAEAEAGAGPISSVTLRVTDRQGGAWIADAVRWVAGHGRRTILRTTVPLPREAISELRRHGVTVMLEIAHLDAAMGAALLGPGSASAASLLQHAQHLRANDLEVGVWLGPLMPAISDERAITALVRHIVAADLRDAHPVLGRLTPTRLRGLIDAAPWPVVATAARAYGIDPEQPEALPAGGVHLSPMADAALRHALRRAADAAGLRLDHCGCSAQCHLDPEQRPALVPLAPRDLFDRLDAGVSASR